MNNKIIALAIAAAFAAPMAVQAAPKIGGQLQAEFADFDRDGSVSDIQELEDNKRGRLWVTGSEDLGGGLKANYRFEWQVETTTGSISDGTRETRVGLSGSWGEFQMGRLKTPYKYTAGVDYDPYTATVIESRGGNGGSFANLNGMTKAYGQHSFLSNSLAYKGKFGKVKFWALYQLAESKSATPDDDNIVLSAKIPVTKNIGIDLAYVEENKVSTTLGGTRAKVGVKFKTGAHKVFVKYETQSSDLANSDASVIFVGYHLTMGKNILTVQYGALSNDVANSDNEYTLVAVKHKFSKKTSVWAGYRTTDSDDNTQDVDVLALGMRINF